MTEQRSELPKVADIMTREVMTLSPQQEILHAMDLLIGRRLSGAPVVDDDGRIVGVLSKKVCLQGALNASYHQQWGGQVADYMASPVETLDPELDILAAASHFVSSNYRRFPVERDGRLLGQVSRLDLLRALARLWR
jgi:CBS-domain-containing membrane protein